VLSTRTAYDLVLLDLKIPGVQGLDALEALRRMSPETAVVVVSGEDDPRVIRAAIERGAMGFVPKASTPEIMIQALRLVLAKGVYLPPGVVDLAIPNGAPLPELLRGAQGDVQLPGLTPRQMDVLRCVISQKLCPKLGGGRVMVKEVLWMTPSSRAAIKNNNTGEIYQMMWEGTAQGQVTLEQDLARSLKRGLISHDTAMDYANNKRRLKQLIG